MGAGTKSNREPCSSRKASQFPGLEVSTSKRTLALSCTYYPPKSGWEKIPEKLDATVAHLIENLPVNPDRIYLMGFSNGAQGTFQALARNPDQYAAAITVAGPVGIKSVLGKIKTPIRAWVGENDNSLNKNVRTIALAKALKEDGVDIELVVVENAGHACYRVPLHDPKVHQWLFSQQRQER